MTYPEKPASYVTINGHTIRSNINKAEPAPPIRISKSKHGAPEYATQAVIKDEAGNEVARLVYDPQQAIMGCGARLVLQTKFPVQPI